MTVTCGNKDNKADASKGSSTKHNASFSNFVVENAPESPVAPLVLIEDVENE